MLTRFRVQGFKSLLDVEVPLPRFTVLFGPNSAGKSNFLDALQAFSRVATSRTLSDAFSPPIRGYPIEAFSFPAGGLSALLTESAPRFVLEGDVALAPVRGDRQSEAGRYRVEVGIQPATGALSVHDEYLAIISYRTGEVKGTPAIETVDGKVRIRRKSKPARPRVEPVGLNYAIASDLRLSGVEYRTVEKVRTELSSWRTYYLDPRVAMRAAKPPSDVTDIGVLGEDIAPFLYRLLGEKKKHFDAIRRTLRSVVPSVEDLDIDLDKNRGILDIRLQQDAISYSSRVISEGTLRVLALCAIAVNPWPPSVVAFEEPENGVHPRRLELVAELLLSVAAQPGRQVVVTTHSPLFCEAVLKRAKDKEGIALLSVRREDGATSIRPFSPSGPLFEDKELRERLSAPAEDGLFSGLMLRGLLDE